jgi:mono/diheme cytochrome c family protein
MIGVLLLGAVSLPLRAQDVDRGRMLYETYCGVCHYERVHDRLRTRIRDVADLRDMVARWAPQTKHRFSLDELEDVVQYLNASHYRFGLPAAKPRQPPPSGR